MTDHFIEVPKKVLPAAQAVLNAAVDAYGCNYSEFHCCADLVAAATLRALADQVVPDEGNFLTPAIATNIRAHILTIATELEGQ